VIGTLDIEPWRQGAPFGFVGAAIWALWLYRAACSRLARPEENDFRTTTSVVVPCYREDPEVLLMCLATWLASEADEVILVVDVDDDECLRVLAQVDDPRLVVLDFVHRGKRSALGAGVRAATGEVVVLSDSDTLWRDGLLTAVQMPFVDPLVGAVGTHQNVYQRTTSIWRRIADWMLNLRYYDYVPAMGRKGAVVCVSGRTAAYRRSVIIPVLHHLEHEFFFGRRCVAGDDGRLTWLVLGSGFRTVHQSSARAISILPDTFTAFVKQRVRWARNSYRTYLTAAWKGWLWRAPFVSKVTVLQILLTPLTMGLSFSYVVSGRLELSAGGVILALVWVLVGRAIRSYSHLRRHPGDLLILPLYALVVIFVAMPIKAYAFVTMNKQGWLTRSDETIGGEGQRASTLVHEPV
jgi:hyaluronan synthase